MSQAKTAKEVLQAMEWIVSNIGWTQGTMYRNRNGEGISPNQIQEMGLSSVCLYGAFRLVEADLVLRREAQAIFWQSNFLPNGSAMDFVRFNDAPGRTKEEVISALRKA